MENCKCHSLSSLMVLHSSLNGCGNDSMEHEVNTLDNITNQQLDFIGTLGSWDGGLFGGII